MLRASCPQGLAPWARFPSHVHTEPCPHVLLWQTSLGGTVRQCLPPYQGKQYPPPPPKHKCLTAVQVLKDAVARNSSIAPWHPLSHCSACWNTASSSDMKPCACRRKWVFSWILYQYRTTLTNLQIQNSHTRIPMSFHNCFLSIKQLSWLSKKLLSEDWCASLLLQRHSQPCPLYTQGYTLYVSLSLWHANCKSLNLDSYQTHSKIITKLLTRDRSVTIIQNNFLYRLQQYAQTPSETLIQS